MARYTGPRDKKSRAAQTKLLLKGERDLTQKSGFARRPYPPGMHGQKRKRAKSEFGTQLLEKQKVKWTYGILERQFKRYVDEARVHKGLTSEALIRKLEGRLDNVVFRLGLAQSRPAARQLVSHGHIAVNGRKVSIPSYGVTKGEVVGVRETHRHKKVFEGMDLRLKKFIAPSWLRLDKEKWEGSVSDVPTRGEAAVPADLQKIIEFYSR